MQTPPSFANNNVTLPTGPPSVAWDAMSSTASAAVRSSVRAGRYSEHRRGEVKLHVCNLPYSTSHWQVGALFGYYGEVLEAFVFKRPHVSNGCRSALVRMASAEAAGRALNGLDNFDWRGNVLRVRISYHDAPNAAVVPSSSGVMVFQDSKNERSKQTTPNRTNSPIISLNNVPVTTLTSLPNTPAPKLDARLIEAVHQQSFERLSVPAWVSEVEPASPISALPLSRHTSFVSTSTASSATQSPSASTEFPEFPHADRTPSSCHSSGSSSSLTLEYNSSGSAACVPKCEEEEVVSTPVFVHNPYSLNQWAKGEEF